jgi:CubicO group peptidase (beta-lactamase class C family)
MKTAGNQAVYSNIGFGLLGHLLGKKAGSSFEDAVIARICEPLQMTDTAVTLTDNMKSRLAQGYRSDDELNGRWEFTDAFAGAGGLCSTVHDMMKFLCANMGLVKTGIDEAILYAQQAHLPEDRLVNPDILLGWFVAPLGEGNLRIIHHSGETGGYHTFIGFNRKGK